MKKGEKKRQRAALKRRARDKFRQRHAQVHASSPEELYIRHAREYPIFECLINSEWKAGGLAQMVIARRQPNGNILFGNYLVDYYCLGLKNTYCNADFTPAKYQRDVRDRVFRSSPGGAIECPVDLAHEIIYGAIEYAARFGFKPQRDFSLSQFILEPADRFERRHNVEFGRNGKPLFISGPHDDAQAIIRQLERTAGPGNYDYLVMIGPPEDDSVMLDEDEQ